MIDQSPWRRYLLATTSIGVNIAVVSALTVSRVGNRPVADYQFPQRLSLNSGQAIADQSDQSNSNKSSQAARGNSEANSSEVIQSHQQYKYVHHEASNVLENILEIDLELTYIVGTRGDVPQYLQNYNFLASKTLLAQQIKQLDVGYHVQFEHQDRAYLSSCISPRSPSSVTQKQFSQNRYRHDLKLQVGWDWLWGTASIRDRRCLWVLISTPIKSADTQASYQTLETVWRDLYHWWLPHFPSL